MSIIKEIKQPVLTNPFISPNIRSILSRLLDSIDSDLDAGEFTVEEGTVTYDILQEYNKALIEENPETDAVITTIEGEEVEISREEMFEDFSDKRSTSNEEENESSKDDLLEDFDDKDDGRKG